jgi:hypothetical protein
LDPKTRIDSRVTTMDADSDGFIVLGRLFLGYEFAGEHSRYTHVKMMQGNQFSEGKEVAWLI